MNTTEARTYQSESEAKEIFRSYQDHVPDGLLLGFEPDPDNPPEGPYRATCVLITMEERTVERHLTASWADVGAWKCGHVVHIAARDYDPITDAAWCADHICPDCRLAARHETIQGDTT